MSKRYVSRIKPWKHQAKALRRLRRTKSALLWADVGTGKTKIAIDHALAHGFQRILVVGPLAAIGVWKRQFLEHTDNIHIVTSNDVERMDDLLPLIHKARQVRGKPAVVVITFNAMVKYVKLLSDSYVPDLFIIDESQYIRNYSATRTRRALAVARASTHRLLLSGTPCPNGYEELYYQIKAVHPGILPSTIAKFRERYCLLGGFMGRDIVGYKNKRHLAKQLAKVTVRIPKSVLNLIPPVDEVVPITLEPRVARVYRELEKEMVAEIAADHEIDVDNHLVLLLRLMQITGGVIDGRRISTAKLKVLKELVEVESQANNKVIIFCQFVQEIKDIAEMLDGMKLSYDIIRGGKSGSARDQIIEDFQEKQDPQILLSQTQAGGVAVTLTKAHTTIFYSLNYNAEAYEQARGRTHRGGQTERCRYIHLLAEGTVDFEIYQALQKKMTAQELLGAVVRRHSRVR